MYIEVRGVGFVNKGAELMLYAILQEVKSQIPEAKFLITAERSHPKEKYEELGIYKKIPYTLCGVDFGYSLSKLIPKNIQRNYGFVDYNDIDVVLDASGLTFGDHNVRSSIRAAQEFQRLKKRDVTIILLPQAFGSFNLPKTRHYFSQIVENTDLIFARDEISYTNVANLVGKRDNIIQAPDFTNLLEGIIPEPFNNYENRVCFIPNNRMITETNAKERIKYIPFMARCINEVLSQNGNPFFLIHGGKEDLLLAHKINKICNKQIDIINEPNPLKVKGIVGSCKGVIGSRFHGLVSSLSQGVPTLATGWNHKYEMLFKEYDYPEGLLKLDLKANEIQSIIIQTIFDDDYSKEIRKKLCVASEHQKRCSKKMWRAVFELIQQQ